MNYSCFIGLLTVTGPLVDLGLGLLVVCSVVTMCSTYSKYTRFEDLKRVRLVAPNTIIC
jgi:hypothetical protein